MEKREREREEGGERSEWTEKKNDCGESGGLDCKWDSVFSFTRKINETVACVCLSEDKSFSFNDQTVCESVCVSVCVSVFMVFFS